MCYLNVSCFINLSGKNAVSVEALVKKSKDPVEITCPYCQSMGTTYVESQYGQQFCIMATAFSCML